MEHEPVSINNELIPTDVVSVVSSMSSDDLVTKQKDSLLRQLKARRRLLRNRAALLREHHRPSPSAPPLDRVTIDVLSKEHLRATRDPVMELTNLIFHICSWRWEHEHQKRLEGIRRYFTNRSGHEKRDAAWDALLKDPSSDVPRATPPPTSEVAPHIDMPNTLQLWKQPTSLKAVVHVEGSMSSSGSETSGIDSDYEMETRVALKHAQHRNAQRSMVQGSWPSIARTSPPPPTATTLMTNKLVTNAIDLL